MVRTFKRFQFWTLTVDGTCFGGDPVAIFRHLKKSRAVAEAMRTLQRLGWVGRWCCVLEFQANGMPHFHLIVEALKGYVPHHRMEQAWNRFRPKWAGPIGQFDGGGERPGVGFVQFEVPKGERAVVRYICGYMAKAGKNEEPQWFRDYRNGKADGKVHNALLFSASRGEWDFWQGVRVKRRQPERQKRGRRNRRRTVEERQSSCRQASDLMRRTESLKNGEIVKTRYEFLGSIDEGYPYPFVCHVVLGDSAEAVQRKPGFWIDEQQLGQLIAARDVAPHVKGCGWVQRPEREVVEPDEDEGSVRWEETWAPGCLLVIDEWLAGLRAVAAKRPE